MRSPRLRGRATVALVAGLGIALSGTAVLGGATAARAAGGCDTPYPAADLHRGDVVTGRTVTQGTRPSGFTGTYIGDLVDGIAPGVDMLMFELDSPEIERVGGIWEGMSGSPVYASDGRLIGAVAYGLSYGASPVAGVTPYDEMDGTMPVPDRVEVPRTLARRIAATTEVSTAEAVQGAHALEIPLQTSLSHRRLAKAATVHKRAHHAWSPQRYLPDDVLAAGGAAAAGGGPTAADIVPGGNLAATLSTGDITMAGVGTVTSVCRDRVVGFGHPMNFLGRSSYGLSGADALYVQADSLGSAFKVANVGATLGTVDQDRMTGISGTLGTLPPTTSIRSSIRYDGHSRTGTSTVQDRTPDTTASVVNYELTANGDRVLDGWVAGSERQAWTIRGTGPDGRFTITAGNRYVSGSDITFDSSWDLADLVYLLGSAHGVSVDSVTSSASAVDATDTYRIVGVQQKRGGKWRAVRSGHPALATAGKRLHVRVKLTGSSHGSFVGLNLQVPRSARGMHGPLWVTHAEPYPFEMSMPRTLSGVLKMVGQMVRNDQAGADAYLSSPSTGRSRTVSGRSALSGKVIRGSVHVPVRVR